MNIKNLVLMALLVGIGAALYIITPGFVQGMKPDFLLTMMFISILLFPHVKETFIVSVATGILSGLFTTFPGGFIPNVIDKFVTGFIFLLLILIVKLAIRNMALSTIFVGIGTIISGTTFLFIALIVLSTDVGATFTVLFIGVVLPAVAFNVVAFIIIYPIVTKLIKRSNFKTSISS